jgi:dTDP-4-dehydrorhamnose reductase
VLADLASQGTVAVDAESVVSPTYVPDLVHATLDLLVDGETGLWHLTNPGAVTWHELAVRSAAATGRDPAAIVPAPAPRLPARRPRFSALGSERGLLLPPLDDAIERYAAAVGAAGAAAPTAVI